MVGITAKTFQTVLPVRYATMLNTIPNNPKPANPKKMYASESSAFNALLAYDGCTNNTNTATPVSKSFFIEKGNANLRVKLFHISMRLP